MGSVEQSDLPKRRHSGIGVKRVDAIVFRCYEHNVVDTQTRNVEAGNIEGLGRNLAIDSHAEELSE
jgi:hypothetical protein